ncbi:MAG: mandelate racemase/muconate lactonizing enzyme family protein [Roseibium album]|uniref:mandelate racemase/muconate lactonizing enzyme family protein n=1 Tax=Roseibium album TaxID=311410 RepID=UPI0032EFCCAB
MKIDAVDFFYLTMPCVTDDVDGSQDALLVRVTAGGQIGWGECEAAPLPSIAAFVCPMSHGACRPVSASVLGQNLDTPEDIRRISAQVAYDSMDLLQAPHTYSGIEMALWDALGRAHDEPVWSLLGYDQSKAKVPYASLLFGDTPQETLERAKKAHSKGYSAFKFGWGPIGRGTVGNDADQFLAAREGIGADALLMVDAGQIFGDDVEAASARLPALELANTLWFEEPFQAGALEAYASLSERGSSVQTAGGEAAHNAHMAEHLMKYGKVGFIQIDCGRVGGIGPAKSIAGSAQSQGVTYVNHTFTSHLALSASLQPYAGLSDHTICEFPASPSKLAVALTTNHLQRDADGMVKAPEAAGLGVEVELARLAPYLVQTEIVVDGKVLYQTPELQ